MYELNDNKVTMAPSVKMADVAENSFKMDTTLWFDKKNASIRKDLIACAQFNTCYNLLKYLARLKSNDYKE